MTEKIAAQLQEVYNNKSRTAKNLIPQGRIPDLGWKTDQQGRERQQLTEPESPATQNTSQTDEGPPSSRLRSKTKKTITSTKHGPTGTQSSTSGPNERNYTGQPSANCP